MNRLSVIILNNISFSTKTTMVEKITSYLVRVLKIKDKIVYNV